MEFIPNYLYVFYNVIPSFPSFYNQLITSYLLYEFGKLNIVL